MPDSIPNLIDGEERAAASGKEFDDLSPHDGHLIARAARSAAADIDSAVEAAVRAQRGWAATSVVKRADVLREIALLIRDNAEEIAKIVAEETGKAPRDAAGETGAAFELGMFIAGEGRRYFGRTTTSAVPNRSAMTIRAPVGVAGLIISANTPIANVAWKVFPALLCGNAAVLKSAEDTPATAWAFGRLCQQVGLPAGVLNIVHGLGEEAGQPLVEHRDVDLVSFTGSCAVGRMIASTAGERMARVCLELGGKNPLVVCDDADIDRAAEIAMLSAFTNAGQRCASGSRLLVQDGVYDEFRQKLLDRTAALSVGPTNEDDFGPVINEKQLTGMLDALEEARKAGAEIIAGGHRLDDDDHRKGCYLAPTILEGLDPDHAVSREELFGPITALYRFSDLDEAIELANNSPFGLTAAIHTRSINRAREFTARVQSGVVSVNGPTYGSEPHMPFGGVKDSGNGAREPGPEALDVYSTLKTVYEVYDPSEV